MSDNLNRYRAINEALHQVYPTPPVGRLAQSLAVLAMFINGIVASGSTHLSISVPKGICLFTVPSSRVAR